MAQPTPASDTPETPTPPQVTPSDKSEVSKKSWIWIVVLLIGGMGILWNKLNEKDAIIQADHIREIQQAGKNTENALEVARLSNELRKITAIIYGRGDSSLINATDFDSTYHAK